MASLGTYKISISPEIGEFKGLGKDVKSSIEKGLDDIKLPKFDSSQTKGIGEAMTKQVTSNASSMFMAIGTTFKNSLLSTASSFVLQAPGKIFDAIKDITGNIAGYLLAPARIAFEGLTSIAQGSFDFIINAAQVAGAGIAAAIGFSLQQAVSNSAEWEQNMGGLEVVFKKNGAAAIDWAKKLSQSSGLSVNEAAKAATTIGQIVQAQGISEEDAFKATKDLIGRASDAAATLGLSTSTALESLTSGLKGNIQVLDNIGAPLTMAMLGQYALSKGVTESTDKMNSQTKTMLIMQYVMEKTANFAGKFADESQTLSGALSILTSSWGNLTAMVASGEGKDFDRIIGDMISGLNNFSAVVVERLPGIIVGLANSFAAILPSAAQGLASIGSAVGEAFVEGFEIVMNSLFSEITIDDRSFANFFLWLIDSITNGISSVARYITENSGIFKERFMAIAPAIGDGLVSSFNVVLELLRTTIIPGFAETIGSLAPSAAGGFLEMFKGFLSILPEIGSAISTILVEALPMIKEAIDTLYDTTGILIETLAPIALQIILGIGEALLDSMNEIVPVITEFMDLLAKTIRDNPELVKMFSDSIAGVVNGLVQNSDVLVDTLADFLGDVLSKVAPKINEKLWDNVWDGLMPMIGEFKGDEASKAAAQMLVGKREWIFSIIQPRIDEMNARYASFGDTIAQAFTNAGNVIAQIGSFISDTIGFIGDVFINIGNFFGDFFTSIGNGFNEFIGFFVGIGNSIGEFFASIARGVTELGSFIADGLSSIIEGVIGIFTFFTEIGSSIGSFFSDTSDNLNNFVNDVIGFITSIPQEIVNFFTEVVNGVINFVTDIGDNFSSIGEDMINGIIQGIQNGGRDLFSTINNTADNMLSWMGKALGINSPSTKFRDYVGKNIILGVHEGIVQNASILTDDMNKIANDIVTDFGSLGLSGELSATMYNIDITVPTPKSNRDSISTIEKGALSGIKKAQVTL